MFVLSDFLNIGRKCLYFTTNSCKIFKTEAEYILHVKTLKNSATSTQMTIASSSITHLCKILPLSVFPHHPKIRGADLGRTQTIFTRLSIGFHGPYQMVFLPSLGCCLPPKSQQFLIDDDCSCETVIRKWGSYNIN